MPIYNKLVRDRIPEKIANSGGTCTTRILDEAEYRTELRAKLQEEVKEYLAAKSDGEAVEELADIMELLRAMAESHGVTVDELEQVRAEKVAKRGGFRERIYLIEAQDA